MPIRAIFPSQLPPDLIKLSAAYRWKTAFAIFSILLFFGLFFSLIGTKGLLIKYMIDLPLNKIPLLMKIGCIVGLVMLLVFLIKFLFHLKDVKPTNRLEVTEKEEPELWQFILQICEHTGAPKPKKIYLDPDVNAYVRYTHSVRSLIMPVGKELTIGYPLLQLLTVAEFQAVMSHEFGHFAQRSMRVGAYVGTANTIISQMINRRDAWDKMLGTWMSIDIRLSFMAWILYGFIWVLRQTMKAFYWLLNVLNASLSREMEFNADKFAVMSTGSIPIISGLWKLEACQNTLTEWLNLAYNAQLKGIYTANVFAKMQTDFNQLDQRLRHDQTLLADDPMGGKKFFTSSVHFKGHMYDSHPPHDEREVSAKQPFIPAIDANQHALLLLNEVHKWEVKLSELIYALYWNVKLPSTLSEEDFTAFATEEKAALVVLENYHNTFLSRYLTVPAQEELKVKVNEPFDAAVLDQLKAELKILMQPVLAFDEQLLHIQSIANGTSRLKKMEIDGKSYGKKQMNEAWEKVWKQRDTYFNEAFSDWDKRLCQVIVQKANSESRLNEVLGLMEQHAWIVEEYRHFDHYHKETVKRVQRLQNMSQVDQEDVNQMIKWCLSVEKEANERITALNTITWLALPNLENIEHVHQLAFPDKNIRKVTAELFNDGSFDIFYNQLSHATQQWLRIEQKSLATLLA